MATTEVAETLGLVDFIQEINIYGVEVPGKVHVVHVSAVRGSAG